MTFFNSIGCFSLEIIPKLARCDDSFENTSMASSADIWNYAEKNYVNESFSKKSYLHSLVSEYIIFMKSSMKSKYTR